VQHEVACNVVKRVSESNLRNVRNLDGFTRSILRRIEQSGIDVGAADLNVLDRDVSDAIMRHVADHAVEQADFTTVQVVNALKEMPVRDAIEVCVLRPAGRRACPQAAACGMQPLTLPVHAGRGPVRQVESRPRTQPYRLFHVDHPAR
jgi:hypothetical protein